MIRYNFTSTLAIEMYYKASTMLTLATLNTSQARSAAAILLCCDRVATSGGGTKCSCKNFPVNINVDLYTLRLLIYKKNCSKVRNSMFATHCTVDTLDVVHTQSLFLKFTELPRPPLFDRSSEFYKYLRKCKHNLVTYWCARRTC